MDDPLLVRGFERVGDLAGDRQRLDRAECGRCAMQLGERRPLDQFHHEGDVGGPILRSRRSRAMFG